MSERSRWDRFIEEARRWATVTLLVVAVVLYVDSRSTRDAANDAKAAAHRAEAAATKASDELAAAIAASNNPELVAAFTTMLNQVDLIAHLLCTATDPVRQAACAAAGVTPAPGGG